MPIRLITNFVLFEIAWFACVLGGAKDQVTIGSIIALSIIIYHLMTTDDAIKESKLLLIATIIGITFESMMTYQGLARYEHGIFYEGLAPVWMILMWPLFATTLNLSMRWLKALNPIYVVIAGALCGPLAYYAGFKLGAVQYDHVTLSLIVISVAWATLLPALTLMSSRLNGFSSISSTQPEKELTQNV